MNETVPREAKIMLLKILQSLSEFLFLIENDATTSIGEENYQAAGRINKNDNQLEDMYQRFHLMPKKRKMLKACMSVLKMTRSRKLVDQVLMHILHSHQENAEILKGSSVEIKYEDYDLYLRHYMYYH